MNKKRLSVVMAGAMLASSVAPVLAEEVQNSVEVSGAQKGELANTLTSKIWAAERFTAKDDALKGLSIYGIQVGDKAPVALAKSDKGTGSEALLQTEIKSILAPVKAGEVVKLVDLGHETVKEDGKDVIISTTSSSKYTEEELKYEVAKELDLLSKKMTTHYATLIDASNTKYDADTKTYTITLQSGTQVAGNKIELTTKSDRLNFNQYVTTDGQTINVTDADFHTAFAGFAKAADRLHDIKETVIEEYKIVSGGDTFELSALYDGLYLTTEGQNILDEAKDTFAKFNKEYSKAGDTERVALVKVLDKNNSDTDQSNASVPGNALKANLVADKDGVYKVEIQMATAYTDKDTITAYDNVITVTSTSQAQLERFVRWIDGANAEIDVLSGSNRYATAVKIAKEVGLVAGTAGTSDIVLVNGRSLVDGLAAAPLASSFGSDQAPILLTEAGKLPSETKRYLKELIDTQINKDITVHIVGGEAVVSDSVKRELRDLGLRVERLGGENREATSMAVADAITDGKIENAFVVGANGEADAMSISGKAAELSTPVIVSSYKGLSEDTLDALDGATVNVIGGESVVSANDFEKIEAIAEKVTRVSGANRKATNAAVINKFYKKSFYAAKSVIVAKDDELIDALTASNLSAQQGAPVVLGTKSLSKEQINAVVTNAAQAKKIYQVGGDVAREVVKTVAEAIGLA